MGKARAAAQDLLCRLQTEKRIDFETPLHAADPRFSTDCLYGDHRGQMFGVLHCIDHRGADVFLKAFSCQHDGVWNAPGWVPPVVDSQAYMKIIRRGQKQTKELTRKIASSTGFDKAMLKNKRRMISQQLMRELHDLYILHNFCGEKEKMRMVYLSGGIPSGAGDCCAPKLLQYAAKNGYAPRGLAEFYFGKATVSHSRIEGRFYSACRERCEPLLGFLLCGTQNDAG
jgi:hemin uptake protein HemP